MRSFYEKLECATVGIAGLGGLGSAVATALARSGIGKLVIADFDIVSQDNLTRQQYFVDQVGLPKVEALQANLARINKDVCVECYNEKLNPAEIERIFSDVDVIAECFDMADQKQMLVETVLSRMGDKFLVSASGLAGYGRSNEIETRRISKRVVCVGDFESGIDKIKVLTAGRVGIVANHQANAIVEFIVDQIM